MNTLELYEKACALRGAGKPFALAAVVGANGSTPQKAGANALFEAAGPVWGTLGGGCMEAESRRRALLSLDNGTPQVFDLKLDEVTGWDDGLICGGKVRILVLPNPPQIQRVFDEAHAALKARKHGVIVTVLQHPKHPLGTAFWLADTDLPETTLLDDAKPLLDILQSGHANTFKFEQGGSSIELYVEPVLPPPALVIAGAGHIGKALAHFGNLLGFEVTVIDDRELYANPENLPGASHVLCGDIAETLAGLPLDPQSYVVIVTRGHRHDGAALAACIHKPAAFFGMIGSKRKSTLIRQALRDGGTATEEQLARVVSPVGVDIGAETVEEIALSIAAQLVAVRRRQALSADAMNYAP